MEVFLDLLLYGAELCFAVLFGMRVEGRKQHFPAACLFALLAFFALLGGTLYLPEGAKPYVKVLFYVLLVLGISLFFRFAYRLTPPEIVFYMNIALAMHFFFFNTASVMEVLLGRLTLPVFVDYLCRYALYATVLFVVYMTVIRLYKGSREHIAVDRSMAAASAVFFCTSVALTVMQAVLSRYDESYIIVLDLCAAFYAVVALIIAFASVQQALSDYTLLMTRKLWQEDRKHYELQKENIEIINIKCHDLRHRIRDFRAHGAIGEQAFEELERSIHIYDALIKTDNEVLDVILSGYMLRCRKDKIELTCMLDGRAVAFMEEMDLYSLFGNMLENAYEYEQSVQEEDNRFISLRVSQAEGKVTIHMENYFIGNVRISDGVVATTKGDVNYHGFGMKSMKRIAEKYGGKMKVTVADGMFQTEIVLPCPAEAEA